MRLLWARASRFIPALLILFLPAYKAEAGEPVTAGDLVENFRTYDGQTVVFQGEAIGDKLERGDGVWINLLDNTGTAFGVWFKPEDARRVNVLGSYARKGDTVLISGVFNRACAQHMGEIDLHAQICQVVVPGYATAHPVSPLRLKIALGLLIVATGLIVLWKKVFKPKQDTSHLFS